MITFKKEKIEGLNDFDSGKTYSDMIFDKCDFEGCTFSSTMDYKLRSIVRNIEFRNCSARGVGIGPGIIEDVLIDGLKVYGHLQTVGAVFKHVTIRGVVNRLMITPRYDFTGMFPEIRNIFDKVNAEYYSKIDWALDISEGLFTDCDIRGIPAHLIRRDIETQIVIKREKALEGVWKAIDHEQNFWTTSIEGFLDSGYNDCVLVAPKKSKNFTFLLEGLHQLRDIGVAEPN